MVKYSAATSLDSVFSALADPTRRAIVARLAEGEASVSELARPFAVSLPAVTKHLAVLERAGLLEHHKEGRVKHCRLVAAPICDAEGWLRSYREFWERRLDSRGLGGDMSDQPTPFVCHGDDRTPGRHGGGQAPRA
ncbi:MAG: ArsR/SmtB family transcription factor [Solirubrobacteraceae bacterium]